MSTSDFVQQTIVPTITRIAASPKHLPLLQAFKRLGQKREAALYLLSVLFGSLQIRTKFAKCIADEVVDTTKLKKFDAYMKKSIFVNKMTHILKDDQEFLKLMANAIISQDQARLGEVVKYLTYTTTIAAPAAA